MLILINLGKSSDRVKVLRFGEDVSAGDKVFAVINFGAGLNGFAITFKTDSIVGR